MMFAKPSYNEDMAWRPIFDEGVAWRPAFVRAKTSYNEDMAWRPIFDEGVAWRPTFVRAYTSYNKDMAWRPIFGEGVAWRPTFVRALMITKMWLKLGVIRPSTLWKVTHEPWAMRRIWGSVRFPSLKFFFEYKHVEIMLMIEERNYIQKKLKLKLSWTFD